MEQEDFDFRIYEIARRIPAGKVTTYGQLAVLAGFPRRARMVGRAMARCPGFLAVPCHRVVNCRGGLVPGWEEQRELLTAEGVPFRSNGCVNLSQCFWDT